jgi:hypothetical protein
MLEGSYLQLGMEDIGASPAEFLDEQKQTTSFERLAAFPSVDFSVTGESQAGSRESESPRTSFRCSAFPRLWDAACCPKMSKRAPASQS